MGLRLASVCTMVHHTHTLPHRDAVLTQVFQQFQQALCDLIMGAEELPLLLPGSNPKRISGAGARQGCRRITSRWKQPHVAYPTGFDAQPSKVGEVVQQR